VLDPHEGLTTLTERLRRLADDVQGSILLAGQCADYMPPVDDAEEALRVIVNLALDVERGIRDPDELSRAVHEAAGLAL
jgi:hypothetical protein